MNEEFARTAEGVACATRSSGRIRCLPSLLYGSIILGPAQQFGIEVIATAAAEDVAPVIRRAGPALADAAWQAVQAPVAEGAQHQASCAARLISCRWVVLRIT